MIKSQKVAAICNSNDHNSNIYFANTVNNNYSNVEINSITISTWNNSHGAIMPFWTE